MFARILWAVFAGSSLMVTMMNIKYYGTSNALVFWIFLAVFLITNITFFCIVGTDWSDQVKSFSDIYERISDIKIYIEKREALSTVVKNELEKFPEYEKELINGVEAKILLNYPKIKANETMVEKLTQLLKLETKVYEERRYLNGDLRRILYRETSPWTIYVPSYENHFGEKVSILNDGKKLADVMKDDTKASDETKT